MKHTWTLVLTEWGWNGVVSPKFLASAVVHFWVYVEESILVSHLPAALPGAHLYIHIYDPYFRSTAVKCLHKYIEENKFWQHNFLCMLIVFSAANKIIEYVVGGT